MEIFLQLNTTLDNSTIYENVIFNNDPQFVDPNNNRLNIPVGSPAQGAGLFMGIK